MAGIVKIPPRKTSREELDYYAHTARVLPRGKFEVLLDASPYMDKELGLEPPGYGVKNLKYLLVL